MIRPADQDGRYLSRRIAFLKFLDCFCIVGIDEEDIRGTGSIHMLRESRDTAR